jgi:hypothetical protein
MDEAPQYRPGDRSTVRRSGRRLKASVLSVVFVAAILLSMSGCSILQGDGVSTLGTESVLADEALLVCSNDCADRGQCGMGDQEEMVLLSSAGPATVGHDMAIPNGAMVTINHEEKRTVIQAATDQSSEVSFYQVDIPEQGDIPARGLGWAAGWCVGQK